MRYSSNKNDDNDVNSKFNSEKEKQFMIFELLDFYGCVEMGVM